MNWKRILLGGAVVFVLGGLWSVIILLSGLMSLVGYDAPFGEPIEFRPGGGVSGVIAQSIAIFVASTCPIWFYAAIRPRFGAGLRTVIYVILTLLPFGVLGNPLPAAPYGLTTSLWGFLPARWVLTQSALYLPSWWIGWILGAWLYKEKGTSGKRMAGNVKWGRIVLGGLVAGVAINLSHFLLNALVKVEASAAVSDHTVLWILYGLVVGVVGVWIYAAIQPRFSAGLRTAIIAGVATWLMLGG